MCLLLALNSSTPTQTLTQRAQSQPLPCYVHVQEYYDSGTLPKQANTMRACCCLLTSAPSSLHPDPKPNRTTFLSACLQNCVGTLVKHVRT